MPVSSFINLSRSEQSQLKLLVRKVLDDVVNNKPLRQPSQPQSLLLAVPGACFVTLYIGKQLRGCIGTYIADQPLWQNVCRYCYYSACEDRRFAPITKSELAKIRFEISILSDLVEIQNNGEQDLLQQLQLGKDGLLLKDNDHSAIFLPSVWQVLPTAAEFLLALKQKGGWAGDYWSAQIKLYKFTTIVINGVNNTVESDSINCL